jgi:protein O-GlcNAc transferase
MRARLERTFTQFIDAKVLSDFEIASRLKQMEIDIAVDLMGFTEGCRPGIFKLRPAPLQVNYLGFPGTLGTDFHDYIIADRIIVPGEDQRYYAEKIVYLPSVMPRDTSRTSNIAPSRDEAGLPEKGFVFASFNNTYKINPRMFDIWMRLLSAVPGSILWMPQFNSTARDNLVREAASRGIEAGRLLFAPFLAALEDHLARLSLADLFLDTLPYNAHSTASDALWAGVPVLTCIGETFAGRVAASLLRAVGLPELVGKSLDEYEAMALTLARNPDRLLALRAKLKNDRRPRPPFDMTRFTRNLESAFATMWKRQRHGEAPETFAVEPPS